MLRHACYICEQCSIEFESVLLTVYSVHSDEHYELTNEEEKRHTSYMFHRMNNEHIYRRSTLVRRGISRELGIIISFTQFFVWMNISSISFMPFDFLYARCMPTKICK